MKLAINRVLSIIFFLCFSFASSNLLAAYVVDSSGTNRFYSQKSSVDTKHNRFIVKFKDSEKTPTPFLRKYISERRIEKLKDKIANGHKIGNRFFHLKSINDKTEVAVTETQMSRSEIYALIKKIEKNPTVDYVEIDEIFVPQIEPNDPYYQDNSQWHLKTPISFAGGANLPQAWDLTTGLGVVVAVLDTGYRPHPDLMPNVVQGYDFIADINTSNDLDGRDVDAQDPGDKTSVTGGQSSWHGTHVAGTIAAVTNNLSGVAGVAFGAKILPVRVLGVGGGWTSDIAAGIRWASGLFVPGVPNNVNKAKVLNLSLGANTTCSSTFQDAINDARAEGSIVVVATGNDAYKNSIGSPANCSGVIAVTAHTRSGDLASYANIGNGTSVSAPGGGSGVLISEAGNAFVYSTSNAGTYGPAGNNYLGYQGTSMATPHVAGVAALLASLKPTITSDEVKSIITDSARPFPAGTYCALNINRKCGSGLLDAKMAIDQFNIQNSVSASHGGGFKLTNSVVNLTGQTTINPITSYEWTQLSGPSVIINNSNTSAATFTAPSVGANFVFKFKVNNNDINSVQLAVSTNTAPVMNNINPIEVTSGQIVTLTAQSVDMESDSIIYTISGQPLNSLFNVATGAFSWNTAGISGAANIIITPSDGVFNGESKTVSINVKSAPTQNAAGGGGGSVGILELLILVSIMVGITCKQSQKHSKNNTSN